MEVKEMPIIFSGSNVRAILDGRQTMTRRLVKNDPLALINLEVCKPYDNILLSYCPYGKIGDRIWVKECWATSKAYDSIPPRECDGECIWYQAGGMIGPSATDELRGKWRPSMFMPRKLSRIDLEITNVRVERLQEISEEDSIAEGIETTPGREGHNDRWLIKSLNSLNGISSTNNPVFAYQLLWESINGSGSWDKNPLVWVIEFKRI